jgi:hypothetical protein
MAGARRYRRPAPESFNLDQSLGKIANKKAGNLSILYKMFMIQEAENDAVQAILDRLQALNSTDSLDRVECAMRNRRAALLGPVVGVEAKDGEEEEREVHPVVEVLVGNSEGAGGAGSRVKLQIMTMAGKTHALLVQPIATVLQLKEAICGVEGIIASMQSLQVEDQEEELENCKQVCEYKLTHESMIYMLALPAVTFMLNPHCRDGFGSHNIRDGPGIEFTAIGRIDSGQHIQIVGESADKNWVKVIHEDSECWSLRRQDSTEWLIAVISDTFLDFELHPTTSGVDLFASKGGSAALSSVISQQYSYND